MWCIQRIFSSLQVSSVPWPHCLHTFLFHDRLQRCHIPLSHGQARSGKTVMFLNNCLDIKMCMPSSWWIHGHYVHNLPVKAKVSQQMHKQPPMQNLDQLMTAIASSHQPPRAITSIHVMDTPMYNYTGVGMLSVMLIACDAETQLCTHEGPHW